MLSPWRFRSSYVASLCATLFLTDRDGYVVDARGNDVQRTSPLLKGQSYRSLRSQTYLFGAIIVGSFIGHLLYESEIDPG
jgi:hypothetical protein